MFWIAFMQRWTVQNHCTEVHYMNPESGEYHTTMTCILDLQVQLTTVFIMLVAMNIVEIFLPIILYKPPKADENEGETAVIELAKAKQDPNSIVHDMEKSDQESMLDEYLEIVIM